MIALTQRKMKLLIGVHGWSAVVLGFLLYAVVFTGTVAVLAKEIGYWSVGHVYTNSALSNPVNDIVQKLSRKVGRAYREDVSVSTTVAGNLGVFFHKELKKSDGRVRSRGVYFKVDPKTGEVLSRREGFGLFLTRSDQPSVLKRFIVDTHVQLYVPRPWGLLLTGILGLAMMAAGVSGFLIHRHLIRDAFTLRARKTSALTARDRHSVAGTWGLPFAFLLAFTGCFFSFAGSIGIPALAMVAFGGNISQAEKIVNGTQFARPGKRIRTADLDAMVADARKRSGGVPAGLSVEYFGRKNAKVTISHFPKFGELRGKLYLYKGLTGEFVRQKPGVGQVPSNGSALVAIIGPLHFGNFAGLLSKAIWVALGFSSCYVIISGLTLWLRRRLPGTAWAWFERYVHVLAIGLPLSLVASAFAFFLYQGTPAVVNATPLGFVIAAAGLCMLALFLSGQVLEKALWVALSLSLLALPVFRIAAGGPGWMSSLDNGAGIVVAVDLMLLCAAAGCGWQVWSRHLSFRSAEPVSAQQPG
ncbi:MAG: PepSY-associated TM helix domain-containing protein [Pseudomonadota bacterium]